MAVVSRAVNGTRANSSARPSLVNCQPLTGQRYRRHIEKPLADRLYRRNLVRRVTWSWEHRARPGAGCGFRRCGPRSPARAAVTCRAATRTWMRWPAHWPCWTLRRWRRERRRHHRPAVLGPGSPGLPGRRGERGGAHAPGRGAGRGRGRAGRPGGGGAAARRRAHLRSGRQRAPADGGHRQPARGDRRGVAGAVVRRGRDRAGPAARGGQALPVRRGAQLLRQAVRSVGVHAGRPGRPDDRRGGRRVRDPAVRERGGRGAALGRGGQEPGQPTAPPSTISGRCCRACCGGT